MKIKNSLKNGSGFMWIVSIFGFLELLNYWLMRKLDFYYGSENGNRT